MREKQIEAYFKKRVTECGGESFKWVSPGRRGPTDQIVIFPLDRVYFVELKATGEQPEDHQVRFHSRLRKLGCTVYGCLDSYEAVDQFILEVCDGG